MLVSDQTVVLWSFLTAGFNSASHFSAILEENSKWCFLSLPVVGFEVPDKFVVGYALDYNEYFRDLNVSTKKYKSRLTFIFNKTYGPCGPFK